MAGQPRFNGVMLVNRLDNLGMLRGRSVLDATYRALPRPIRHAYRDRHAASQSWLPMEWLRQLHATIEEVTGAGIPLSKQLGYFGTRRAFGRVGGALAGITSPKHLFALGSKIFHVYYEQGSMKIVHSEAQMVVARWDGCVGFDAHNWQVTFGSSEALLELAHAHSPHLEVVSGGDDGDESAEITVLWV